jgi:membrane-associated phospholipid phosphatase
MSAKRFLERSLLALVACTLLVVLTYFFIDRPVAYIVHERHLNDHQVLVWLQRPPEAFTVAAPIILALGLIRAYRGALGPVWKVGLAASVSLLASAGLVLALKLAFGRTWPESWPEPWRADNPSLIQDGVYGFHPFQGGIAYAAFPSGHMARTLAVTSVLWLAWPRWRWAYAVLNVLVVVGLIGMNHHFVGDVIAGGFLGWLCGSITVHTIAGRPSDGTGVSSR